MRRYHLALLRILVAPRRPEEAEPRRLVRPEDILCPIRGLRLQAPALPEPTVRLYFAEVFPGRRRSALLALTA